MKVFSLIKKVDLLTKGPTLKVQGKDFYKTWIGGFLTLAIILLSFTGGSYFFLKMINKKDPYVVSSQQEEK